MTQPLTTAQAAARLGLSRNQAPRLTPQGRIVGASFLERDWVFTPPLRSCAQAAAGVAAVAEAKLKP